jgi:hypothetical protein
MTIAIFIIASVLCGILGRMGGSGNYPRQARTMGIPLLCVALIALYGFNLAYWWVYIITFGLLCASISTYWDFLFGYDNFWFHGFMIGLALTPISIVTGHWLGVSLTIALYTLWMGFWSKIINWDVAEEFIRYCIVPIGVFHLCK